MYTEMKRVVGGEMCRRGEENGKKRVQGTVAL